MPAPKVRVGKKKKTKAGGKEVNMSGTEQVNSVLNSLGFRTVPDKKKLKELKKKKSPVKNAIDVLEKVKRKKK